jgi:hypothetical protein
MKWILLSFPSADQLIGFTLAVDPGVLKMDLDTKTLFCCCNDYQVELANYVYEASVLEMPLSLN